MISSILSLSSYFIFNGVLALGYLASRTMFSLPFFKTAMSQGQRLQFVRYFFIAIIVSYFAMPSLLAKLPLVYQSNFKLQPMLKSASAMFLQQHGAVNTTIHVAVPSTLSASAYELVLFFIALGMALQLAKYIYNLYSLSRYRLAAYCQHKLNQVYVLFHDKTELPFCWSFLTKHFIVIPHAMIDRQKEVALAIRHELQHIRQGDTHWLHFLSLLKAICFWNPLMKCWLNWFSELQEFSCDEALVIKKKVSPVLYAESLASFGSNVINKQFIPAEVLGMSGLSKTILYRRVNMLFQYQNRKMKKVALSVAYVAASFAAVSVAFALNGASSSDPLSTREVQALIKESHLDQRFHVSATPEVVMEINNIRSSEEARTFMQASLERMKKYQPIIQSSLKRESMPNDLLVLPLVESGYQPLEQSKNPVLAAGIWQIIPSTATRYGLTVSNDNDDRLDTKMSTNAALAYLNSTYAQFNDWKLACIAYEIGENHLEQLIKETGSRDAWVLARSPSAPKDLTKFVAMFDAEMIIMHHPGLVG